MISYDEQVSAEDIIKFLAGYIWDYDCCDKEILKYGYCKGYCMEKDCVEKCIIPYAIKIIKEDREERRSMKELEELKKLEEEHRLENGRLRAEYNELVRFVLEDAFNDLNENMEGTLRCLLKQGIIKLQNNHYIRNDLPIEDDGMYLIGIPHKRERVYFLEDDEIDDYTKSLEQELKEYENAKLIFKKYNIKDETMYECIKRLERKVEELSGRE